MTLRLARRDLLQRALRDHHTVSVAVIVAVGANTDRRREVLGMTVGNSEAEPFWTEFLRILARRGLRGVKLVISDAHEGLKAAITKVLGATRQRCRVGLLNNPVRLVRPSGRSGMHGPDWARHHQVVGELDQ